MLGYYTGFSSYLQIYYIFDILHKDLVLVLKLVLEDNKCVKNFSSLSGISLKKNSVLEDSEDCVFHLWISSINDVTKRLLEENIKQRFTSQPLEYIKLINPTKFSPCQKEVE